MENAITPAILRTSTPLVGSLVDTTRSQRASIEALLYQWPVYTMPELYHFWSSIRTDKLIVCFPTVCFFFFFLFSFLSFFFFNEIRVQPRTSNYIYIYIQIYISRYFLRKERKKKGEILNHGKRTRGLITNDRWRSGCAAWKIQWDAVSSSRARLN